MIEAIEALSADSAVEYHLPVVAHVKPPAQDQVVLSVTAQEKLLEQEGLTVAEIADKLGVTVSAVQTDLAIGVAASTASTQTKVAAA